MENLNDKKFVRKLKAGDAEASRELYLALAPRIASFLRRTFEMSVQDAEEVANDAMLKVYKGVATFDQSRGVKFTTWVFKVAKNACIDQHRKAKSIEVEGSGGELLGGALMEFVGGSKGKIDEPATEQIDIIGEAERACPRRDSAVWRAYDTLNEKEKDILRMRDIMSYEEIATVEGSNVNAVSTRYSRALQKLKAAYEKENENER